MPQYEPLYYSLIDISVTDVESGLGYGTLTNFQETPLIRLDFEINGSSTIEITDLPLIKKKVNYHVNSQINCNGIHGFFDMEEKSCTMAYQLTKVCLKVKYDKET